MSLGGVGVETILLSTIWAYPWQLLRYHLSTSKKKKPHAKPSQTPWIIIAEENWHIEITVIKLVLPWVNAPGRLKSIESLHVSLFGMNLECRVLCILIFLVFVLPLYLGLDSKMFCFPVEPWSYLLWKLGCCVNGLSRMDLVNASLCSDNPSPLWSYQCLSLFEQWKSTNIFVLFCVMYIYAFLCN